MNAGTNVIDVLHIDDNRGDLDLVRSAFEDCCPSLHYLGETDPVAAMAQLGQRAAKRLPLPNSEITEPGLGLQQPQEL